MENQKVMEAAYNFTDAVIENKEYTIEKSAYIEGSYFINVSHGTLRTSIAAFVVPQGIFSDMLPIRFAHQQQLVLEVQKFHEEQERKTREEEQLKEQFNEWRKNNGK